MSNRGRGRGNGCGGRAVRVLPINNPPQRPLLRRVRRDAPRPERFLDSDDDIEDLVIGNVEENNDHEPIPHNNQLCK
jgi:hypothetical protein